MSVADGLFLLLPLGGFSITIPLYLILADLNFSRGTHSLVVDVAVAAVRVAADLLLCTIAILIDIVYI